MKETKDDINRWKDIPCACKGRINIMKMTILLKAIYRVNGIYIKLPMVFFTELEQKISQFITHSLSHSVMSNSLRLHGLQPTRLLCPWDSPGKNTGVGRHFLLLREYKRPFIGKEILQKKNRAEGINLHDFRLYCKAIFIKTVCNRQKNRNID